MPIRFCLVIGSFLLGSLACAGELMHESPKNCQRLLRAETVTLAELLATGVVEPDSDNLFSPRTEYTDHEYRTATLLAARLGRSVALIPTMSDVDIPAVDGILFDQAGLPTHNFSLKTFMPSSGSGIDLNFKLDRTVEKAKQQIRDNYLTKRVVKIVKKWLPDGLSPENREMECNVQLKIFGFLERYRRPVTIVIDHTLDRTAIFRQHGRLDENNKWQLFLTLNGNDGVDLIELVNDLRSNQVIKEFVFLSPHNMFHVTPNGYQMTEFCDVHGHSHDYEDPEYEHIHGQGDIQGNRL